MNLFCFFSLENDTTVFLKVNFSGTECLIPSVVANAQEDFESLPH